jgi:hypothetical protein
MTKTVNAGHPRIVLLTDKVINGKIQIEAKKGGVKGGYISH